jgi:Ankyrin repeats (3 copies)
MKMIRAAVEDGYIEVIRVIANHNLWPSIKCDELLHIACRDESNKRTRILYDDAVHMGEDFPAVVSFLISMGCDVNCLDSNRDSPMHTAAKDGTVEIAALLIASGAKFEMRNRQGDTPLHLAAKFDRFDFAVTLIRHGVDISIQNNWRETAREVALDFAERHQVTYNRNIEAVARLELPNETRTTVLLELVGKDLAEIQLERREAFMAVMVRYVVRNPWMNKELIPMFLEGTGTNVQTSTKYVDVDGIVRLVKIVADQVGMRRV